MTNPGRNLPDERLQAPRNMLWTPRPGWATVRLMGTCADPALRRGEMVMHITDGDHEYANRYGGEISQGTLVIVMAREAHLIEDDLHLVPEESIVAVGEALP